jgi:hypothetical protein
MDAELPVIRTSELVDKATSFARDLINQLDALNQEYPTAEMSQKEKEVVKKALGDRDVGPVPQQFTSVFERLFLAYMASRFVVVPD